jgi:hypothetical protein
LQVLQAQPELTVSRQQLQVLQAQPELTVSRQQLQVLQAQPDQPVRTEQRAPSLDPLDRRVPVAQLAQWQDRRAQLVGPISPMPR